MKPVAAITGLIGAIVMVAGAACAQPRRVMSLTECTDQLVLALLPPDRITSVTWLSRDPSGSVMAAAAARVPINHGSVEEVLRDRPDLVITDTFTPPATQALLQRLHYPVLELKPADSFEDIRTITRKLARAVDAEARAEALIAHMDSVLKALAEHPGAPVRVAAWDGSGFAAQKGSLYDTILIAAGARNVVDEPGPGASGAASVESLLAAAPALIVRGEPRFEAPGRRNDLAFHPLVRRFWASRTVIAPQSLYLCGTPFSADAALNLRNQIRALAAIAARPLPFQQTPAR